MSEMPDEKELDAFAERLRMAFSTLPAPASDRLQSLRAPTRRRAGRPRLIAAAACALVLVLVTGTLAVTRRLAAQPPSVSVHALAAAPATCRLPVTVLANGVKGFVDFRGGSASFKPAPSAGTMTLTYLPAFHQWVDAYPRQVAPGGRRYVTWGNPKFETGPAVIMRANGTKTTWPLPKGATPWAWSREGIVLQGVGDSLRIWLLDPGNGSIRTFTLSPSMQIRGDGSIDFLPIDDSFWTEQDGNHTTTILSESLATGAVQTWYDGPGAAHLVGVTTEGNPILQVATRDVTHEQPNGQNGASEQTLLFTSPGHSAVLNQGVVGQPNVAADLSPLSATAGSTVWMADDQGGIWTYTPSSGMREVAKIRTTNDGAPGISISGPC